MLGTARLAGIMAAKRTHELIPLCHPLLLTKVTVDLRPRRRLPGVRVTRDGEGVRPDRRRDGSADRRFRRLPDDLRHGEGRRPRHADRGRPPAREERRPLRSTTQAAMSLISRRGGARAVLASVASRRSRLEACLARQTPPGACSPKTSSAPRATSRPSLPPPWTATRCAAPMSRKPRHRCASIGISAAGHASTAPSAPGEAVRIFTGAPLPDGADTHRHPGKRRAPRRRP